jgi:uncharacterized membrane protein YfcA
VEAYYLLLLFAVTSAALYLAARRGLRLRPEGLRPALGRVLECAGLAVLVAAFNVAVGFLLVLALRRLTGSYVSLYLNTDGTLLVLSLLQAIALQWWMRDAERR